MRVSGVLLSILLLRLLFPLCGYRGDNGGGFGISAGSAVLHQSVVVLCNGSWSPEGWRYVRNVKSGSRVHMLLMIRGGGGLKGAWAASPPSKLRDML